MLPKLSNLTRSRKLYGTPSIVPILWWRRLTNSVRVTHLLSCGAWWTPRTPWLQSHVNAIRLHQSRCYERNASVRGVPIDRIWVSFQLWGPWVCGVFRDFCGRKSLFAWYGALSTLLYPHHWRLHVLYRNIVWAWEQHRGKSPAAHHQGQLRAGASSTGCIVFAGHSLWSWCYRPNPCTRTRPGRSLCLQVEE